MEDEIQINEKKKKKALVERDAIKYAKACDALGIEPEDEELYERGLFERAINRKQEERRLKKATNPFGIRKADLNRLSYIALEDFFYGLWNLNIPKEMLEVLNPEEIAAKYIAAGLMKRYNAHLKERIPREFLGLVSLMDLEAHPYIRKMAARTRKKFSSGYDEQRTRLSGLEKPVQDVFVNSFFEDYVPSTREEPTNPYAFLDPNSDGNSKERYVNEILKILKKIDCE